MRIRETARPVLVTGLAVTLLCATAPADAATRATASRPQAASTLRWAAVPTNSASATGTGPLTLTFAKSNNSPAPPQYFNVINTGTTALGAVTYGLVQSDSTMIAVEACSTTWNEAAHSCAGTIATIVTTTAGGTTGSARSTIAPNAPGALLRLRLRPTVPSRNAQDIYTVSTSVDRAAVRAATSTSS